jgi:hypothetical protein
MRPSVSVPRSSPRPRRRRATVARAVVAALVAALAAGCEPRLAAERPLTADERAAIARVVERRLREATDLRAGGTVERMLAIYPDSGRVISASGGAVSTARDSLAAAVGAFWRNVGQNMRNPEWRWGPMHVDVLGRDAAVVTATYRIPHLTPRGEPHVLGGAWTAVFARRGAQWVVVQEHLSDVAGEVSPTP